MKKKWEKMYNLIFNKRKRERKGGKKGSLFIFYLKLKKEYCNFF